MRVLRIKFWVSSRPVADISVCMLGGLAWEMWLSLASCVLQWLRVTGHLPMPSSHSPGFYRTLT